MLIVKPTASIKGGSVSAFSGSNKTILEKNLEDILKEGIKSTFLFGDSDYQDDLANNFAKTMAPALADAIDGYIQNMIKSQSIIITPAALVSPVGPVTGVMSTMTDIQIM